MTARRAAGFTGIRRKPTPALAAAAAVILTAVLAGCHGSTGDTSGPALASPLSSPSGAAARGTGLIEARPLAPYGTVLETAEGKPVYVFAPDDAHGVTCHGSCSETWPPLRATGSAAKTAGAGTFASLVGSDSDSSGGAVVTYDGWPLYTYIADVGAGNAAGESLDLNGGYWYLISPSGKVIKAAP